MKTEQAELPCHPRRTYQATWEERERERRPELSRMWRGGHARKVTGAVLRPCVETCVHRVELLMAVLFKNWLYSLSLSSVSDSRTRSFCFATSAAFVFSSGHPGGEHGRTKLNGIVLRWNLSGTLSLKMIGIQFSTCIILT